MNKLVLYIIGILVCFLATNLKSQTKIIMKKDNGVFYIPCKINGLDLSFIFDTGASNVTISLTEASFMLKNGYLKKSDLGEEVYYGIADGTISTGTRINLREIEFAGLTLYNVDASIVHTASAPLLLGQSALAKLGTISMDLKNGTLSIDKGNANYDFANSNSYEFEYSVSVYDYAPIIEFPNMITSNTIGFAKNGFVNVLNKTNPNYYLIKSEDKVGYMWIGWMK